MEKLILKLKVYKKMSTRIFKMLMLNLLMDKLFVKDLIALFINMKVTYKWDQMMKRFR